MTTPISTGTFTIVPDDMIVGETVPYVFTITQSIDIHEVNDYAVFTIPSLMALPNTVACTVVSGITTVTCVRVSATTLRVTYTSAPTNNIISFSVADMINYKIGDDPVTYTLKIYDELDYEM